MNEEDKQRNYELARKLLAEQNFAAAIIAGAIATLLAAAAFGLIVATWPTAYGFAAAGTGLVIGLPMGFLGRGITTKFAVAAALYTIIGGVLGNLSWVILGLGHGTWTSLIDVLHRHSLPALVRQAVSNAYSIYLLYWFIAIFAAVFLARRALSRSDRLAIGLFGSRD